MKIPKPFEAVLSSVEQLHEFLNAQSLDCSPLILHQPPSTRPARRDGLNQCLSIIETQWNYIQSITARFTAVREELTRQRAMCLSCYHPISALPHELLRQVFSYLPRVEYHGKTMAVTQVCKYWRSIALDYQELWAAGKVDIWGDLSALAWSLSRSGSEQHPFHLVVDGDVPISHALLGEMRRFLSYADRDVRTRDILRNRVSSLKWISDGMSMVEEVVETLGEMERSQYREDVPDLVLLPRLEYFEASAENKVYSGGISLARMECPNLRTIVLISRRLIRSPSSVHVFNASSVTSIYMKSTQMDYEHFRYLFLIAPRLEHIEFIDLHGLDYAAAHDTDPVFSSRILCPREVHLQDCGDGLLAVVLAYLTPSRLTHLLIQPDRYGNRPGNTEPWCKIFTPFWGPSHTFLTLTRLVRDQVLNAHNMTNLNLLLAHHTMETILRGLVGTTADTLLLPALRTCHLELLDNNSCREKCPTCEEFKHNTTHSAVLGSLLLKYMAHRAAKVGEHREWQLERLCISSCVYVEGLEYGTKFFDTSECSVCINEDSPSLVPDPLPQSLS